MINDIKIIKNKLDLHNNKYSIKILKENIYALGLINILNTQKIDESFAVNYILNEDFQLTEEESRLSLHDIIKYQPHLNLELLLKLYFNGPETKLFNFEKYAI